MKTKMKMKRRGRPPGSKNKPKAPVAVVGPKQLMEVADAALAKQKPGKPAEQICPDCNGDGYVPTTPGVSPDAAKSQSQCPRCTGLGKLVAPLKPEPPKKARLTPLHCHIVSDKAKSASKDVEALQLFNDAGRELAIARTHLDSAGMWLDAAADKQARRA